MASPGGHATASKHPAGLCLLSAELEQSETGSFPSSAEAHVSTVSAGSRRATSGWSARLWAHGTAATHRTGFASASSEHFASSSFSEPSPFGSPGQSRRRLCAHHTPAVRRSPTSTATAGLARAELPFASAGVQSVSLSDSSPFRCQSISDDAPNPKCLQTFIIVVYFCEISRC